MAEAPRPVWDCHTDVLSKLLLEPLPSFVEGRGEGPCKHYDLPRIERGGVSVMVCALFCRDDAVGEPPVEKTLRMIDNASQLEALTGGRVAVARSRADLERITGEGRTALVLSIENAIACLDKLELLRCYHRLGVRAIGLTWNGRNYVADGCMVAGEGSRLTPFGRDLVDEMGRLGMVIDVSHLSEGCFWEVIERARGPVIASHSNARALCDHPRNLTDAQIAAIRGRGGVVGINFYPVFLETGAEETSADRLVDHALHLLEHAGEEGVGIGSDYDGIGRGPKGAEDPSCFPSLAERLLSAGVPEQTLDRVFFSNFRRVFEAALG